MTRRNGQLHPLGQPGHRHTPIDLQLSKNLVIGLFASDAAGFVTGQRLVVDGGRALGG